MHSFVNKTANKYAKPILQQNKQNTPILGRHLRMPRPLASCSETLKHFDETLQRFRIYVLSYEALQRFIEALSNLMLIALLGSSLAGTNIGQRHVWKTLGRTSEKARPRVFQVISGCRKGIWLKFLSEHQYKSYLAGNFESFNREALTHSLC